MGLGSPSATVLLLTAACSITNTHHMSPTCVVRSICHPSCPLSKFAPAFQGPQLQCFSKVVENLLFADFLHVFRSHPPVARHDRWSRLALTEPDMFPDVPRLSHHSTAAARHRSRPAFRNSSSRPATAMGVDCGKFCGISMDLLPGFFQGQKRLGKLFRQRSETQRNDLSVGPWCYRGCHEKSSSSSWIKTDKDN